MRLYALIYPIEGYGLWTWEVRCPECGIVGQAQHIVEAQCLAWVHDRVKHEHA